MVNTLVRNPVEEASPQRKEIQNLLKLIGVWFGYVLALPVAGFSISTFFLVAISSIVMGGKLRGAVLLGLGVVVTCFFLFSLWLKVPLPSAAFLS
jgi:hypothetical protein